MSSCLATTLAFHCCPWENSMTSNYLNAHTFNITYSSTSMLLMRAFPVMEDLARVHVPFQYSVKVKCKSGGFRMAWHYRTQYKWRSTREINYLCRNATNNVLMHRHSSFLCTYARQSMFWMPAWYLTEGLHSLPRVIFKSHQKLQARNVVSFRNRTLTQTLSRHIL